MKKGICVFLAATLLCVSIAGCSVSGQTESLLEKSQSIGTSDNTSLQANPELSESAYNTDDFYCALEDMAIPDTPILQIQFYDRTTGIITNFESSDDIERIFAILQGLEIQPSVSPTLEIAQQNAGSYYTLRFNKSKNDMQPLYTIDLDPFELQVGNMRTGFLSVANTEEIVAQLQAEATKERWISPTGDYPYTSQAAWEYYEEHPQLQEYYHQYLVPLGYLNGISSWENFDEIPLSPLWTWVWCQLSEEERENVPSLNPLTKTLIPFGLIQEKAAAYFEIDALDIQSLMQKYQSYYLPAYNAFENPGWTYEFLKFVDIITDSKQQDDILTLTIHHVLEHNFPSGDYAFEGDIRRSKERIYQMRIRLLEDGTFRYVSYCQIN